MVITYVNVEITLGEAVPCIAIAILIVLFLCVGCELLKVCIELSLCVAEGVEVYTVLGVAVLAVLEFLNRVVIVGNEGDKRAEYLVKECLLGRGKVVVGVSGGVGSGVT